MSNEKKEREKQKKTGNLLKIKCRKKFVENNNIRLKYIFHLFVLFFCKQRSVKLKVGMIALKPKNEVNFKNILKLA